MPLLETNGHIDMAIKLKFTPEIPDGSAVFSRVSVAGIQPKKKAALKFASNRNQSLEFKRETGNKQDPNAIQVIGRSKGRIFEGRAPIGYVPRVVASCIVEGGFWNRVEPELLNINVKNDKYVEIEFQLLGPENQKKTFNDLLQKVENRRFEDRPATVWQKEFYRTFDLEVPKGLTYLAAKQFIDEKSDEIESDDEGALQAWKCYGDIVKELFNPKAREVYNVKRVNISHLRSAVIALLDEGYAMEAMRRDISVVVDKLIELHPNLEGERGKEDG